MIPEKYSFRLLQAWQQAGRKDLKLSECIKAFYQAYQDVIDLQNMQPKFVGDWFATFLSEYPQETIIPDATLLKCDNQAPEYASEDAMPSFEETQTNDATEIQIKNLKQEGLSNREIGRRLGVSEATIRRKLKS
jgi:DNA-binding NarL/FixJ family response regulator